MALIFDTVRRLEADPLQSDLARGFAAEVADPAWLLGRQWQLGEHRGEDASSPVRVTYRARLTPVDPLDGQPHLDPRTTPAEAFVESEPGDSWTAGRRIAAGRRVAAATSAAGSPLPDDPGLRLRGLPAPYDLLDGTGYDGALLWAQRAALGLDQAWFGELRPPDLEPVDLWDPTELTYQARFQSLPRPARGRRGAGGRRRRRRTSPGHRRHAAPAAARRRRPRACATPRLRCRAGGRSRTPGSTSAATRPTAGISRPCC
jgi:hypothetical protein